jgi:hypothetical protein
MTTTGERNRLDRRSATAELRAATVVPPRGRRRPALLMAGLAMVALGALAAIWLMSSSGHRVEVVMLARDVAYGSVLQADDLTTTAVAVDPSVAVVPANQVGTLVGQTATANLTRGSLLSRSDVTSAGVLGANEVLVPMPLPADRMPAGGLRAGDRLLVVDAPPVGADPPPAAPASLSAKVVRVGSPDVNGTVVVDVVASSGDGPALATRAATGRFAIVVLPAATP